MIVDSWEFPNKRGSTWPVDPWIIFTETTSQPAFANNGQASFLTMVVSKLAYLTRSKGVDGWIQHRSMTRRPECAGAKDVPNLVLLLSFVTSLAVQALPASTSDCLPSRRSFILTLYWARP